MCPVCFDRTAPLNSCWVEQGWTPSQNFKCPEAVYFEDGAAVEEICLTSQPSATCFCFLCGSLMPAEAWCIQSSLKRVSPCRDGWQIQPPGACRAPAYCRAFSRVPGLLPSASCSPGSTQLMWLQHSLSKCSLQLPPPPPVLLLHPSLPPARYQASLASQSCLTQDGAASETFLIESWYCSSFLTPLSARHHSSLFKTHLCTINKLRATQVWNHLTPLISSNSVSL